MAKQPDHPETPVLSTRKMDIKDAEQSARLYQLCFPDELLSGLGFRFLQQYFRFVATDPSTQVTVLEDPQSHRILGVAASTYSETLYKDVVKSAPLTTMLGTLVGLFRSQSVRSQFLRIGRTISRLMRTKSVDGADALEPPEIEGPVARGLYIAVHPDGRGRGNADLLLNEYTSAAFAAGAVRLIGMIRKANMPSVILHRRHGWQFLTEGARHHVWKDNADVAPANASS